MSGRADRFETPPGTAWRVRAARQYSRQCCDCGLVHAEIIGVRGKDVVCQVARDELATERARQKMKLAEWLALRAICNAHIRRLNNAQKDKGKE